MKLLEIFFSKTAHLVSTNFHMSVFWENHYLIFSRNFYLQKNMGFVDRVYFPLQIMLMKSSKILFSKTACLISSKFHRDVMFLWWTFIWLINCMVFNTFLNSISIIFQPSLGIEPATSCSQVLCATDETRLGHLIHSGNFDPLKNTDFVDRGYFLNIVRNRIFENFLWNRSLTFDLSSHECIFVGESLTDSLKNFDPLKILVLWLWLIFPLYCI